MLAPTSPLLIYAHWYSGRLKKHRHARDKRYCPKTQLAYWGRNRFSRRMHYKTNRWNYMTAYKDMP